MSEHYDPNCSVCGSSDHYDSAHVAGIGQLVFVISRYRAGKGRTEADNIQNACELGRKVFKAGYTPVIPHLYLTRILDDAKPDERAKGITAGHKLMSACQEVWVDPYFGISEGMEADIQAAKEMKKRIIYL